MSVGSCQAIFVDVSDMKCVEEICSIIVEFLIEPAPGRGCLEVGEGKKQ